eukprot:11809769-Ditylum_brightwellii.AAC.1
MGGLLKVSQGLRCSEKSILGGRLPRALQQYSALYFAPVSVFSGSYPDGQWCGGNKQDERSEDRVDFGHDGLGAVGGNQLSL